MTVKELYNWAVAHKYEDAEIVITSYNECNNEKFNEEDLGTYCVYRFPNNKKEIQIFIEN